MPVDAKLDDEADLYRFTKVDDVLGYLQRVKALKILVLDPCRDNPFAEALKRSLGLARASSLQRGLARIEAPIGTIISYSTQAGRTAADGKGRNSPYTMAFLRHIEGPKEIGEIFRDIGDDVFRATSEKQLPELSLSIIGKFYLKGPISVTANVPPQPALVDPCTAAGDHWKSAESIGSLAAFEDHLARFSSCSFAGLAKARIDALKTKVAVVVPPLPLTKPPLAQEVAPAAIMKPSQSPSPCGGILAAHASLSSRAAKPLAAAEECGLKPGDVFKECDPCAEMVVVPAGSFIMGGNDAKKKSEEVPRHQVTFAQPFAVGRVQVTMAQFAAFVGDTGYEVDDCFPGGSWRHPPSFYSKSGEPFSPPSNHPVVCVSWDDANAYVAWLLKKTGKAYRLLTEAEWEYAARAGTTTEWFWGNEKADAKAYARCFFCSLEGVVYHTAPVGSYKPNMFGLYDMAGNGYQLLQDCWHGNYDGAPTDGSAWREENCSWHVIRGGGWTANIDGLRSAKRSSVSETNARENDIGIRVGRTLRP
jgi:formylglycine-generating enzyme required for sulfatase activity